MANIKKNLNGEQLFDLYTSEGGEYRQVLFLAYSEIEDKLYPMLEEAERTGKKIAIKEELQGNDDTIITVVLE